MRKIADGDDEVVHLSADLRQLLMRAAQKVFQHSQLIHQLERGGMNGVAAKVAQEIGVFFQHHYINSGAGEQEATHHPRGAAAHDATARGDRFGCWIFLRHGWAPGSTRAITRIIARMAHVTHYKRLSRKREDWRERADSQ